MVIEAPYRSLITVVLGKHYLKYYETRYYHYDYYFTIFILAAIGKTSPKYPTAQPHFLQFWSIKIIILYNI